MLRCTWTLVLVLLAWTIETPAADSALRLHAVGEAVYGVVGELGNRRPENLGNNATFGFVITSEGVVLLDSGGSYKGAAKIHELIRTVTDQPVRLVINTGGQDHRWLGNGYFRERGAKVMAHRRAVEDQMARAQDQFFVLGNLIGDDGLQGTEAVFADETFSGNIQRISFGGLELELHHAGTAHTPGDIFVWLPREKVVFAGDIAFVGRLLGIGVGNSASWVNTFEAMAALAPETVVPGHGVPSQMNEARADTYEYLRFLRGAVAQFMEADGEIQDVGSIDQSAFSHLLNFEALKGRNAQKVFEELEWE